ncbi:hypothetical protein V8C37DRAFT_307932 [Trichoderma ceciliae]
MSFLFLSFSLFFSFLLLFVCANRLLGYRVLSSFEWRRTSMSGVGAPWRLVRYVWMGLDGWAKLIGDITYWYQVFFGRGFCLFLPSIAA